MQIGAPLTIGNENDLVNAIEIVTTNNTASFNVDATGELVFHDVNGANSMSALVAGSGSLVNYYTKVETESYADTYKPQNNAYTLQYKSNSTSGFAASANLTFQNNTLTSPYIDITNSATTYALTMTDIVDGQKYGICVSGGTFVLTAI